MGQTLYLECYTGISGDMAVAALLDLGADQKVLKEALNSLPVQGFQIQVSRVKKAGLDVCDFDVKLDAEHENHDHDMEYLYGHVHGFGEHDHAHGGEHEYGGHSHGHEHEEHSHEHVHVQEHGEHSHEHKHSHAVDSGQAVQEHMNDHGEEHIHEHVHGQEHGGHSHAHGGEHEHGAGGHSHDHGHGEHSHEHKHSHAADSGRAVQEHMNNHGEEHIHEHDGHSHEHVHNHEHTSGHHHEHRGLPEILAVIDAAAMTDRAKETARRIFTVLADAEAKAHGVPADQVHFHEVGAIDSIADILAVAVCLDNLDITEVIVPYLCEGRGTVRCQHGILPVPVPAVANIVQKHGLALRILETEGELVTPTGAAVVAAVRTSDRLPEHFVIQNIGIGAGKRKYENPSLLRAMLIKEQEPETGKMSWEREPVSACGAAQGQREPVSACGAVQGQPAEPSCRTDCVYKLETNIDDCTGEALGHVMEKLLLSGARDVHFVPVYMKKHRPAYELCVICSEAQIPALEAIIFKETTTIGIRRIRMERTVLRREKDTVMLPCGALAVKKCTLPDGEVRCYPEYESAAALAKAQGLPFLQVMEQFYRFADQENPQIKAEAWL